MTSQTPAPMTGLSKTPLQPFGLVVEATGGDADFSKIPYETLSEWTEEARVLVLRGFPLLTKENLIEYCRGWGEILTWDFGEVLDLVIHETPKNYLFTRGDVPFHWDGAFAKATPRYFLFQCLDASPGGGGETVFCDTTMVYRDIPPQTRRLWQDITVNYRTDKVEHYGGRVSAPLVSTHPASGVPVLRYAEPLPPETYLNPLFVEFEGLPQEAVPDLQEDLRDRLHRPAYCYAHPWQSGDIVIADNYALVHGRNPFTGEATRHLQRIQVI
jgi:alpha-ketoglutarate-dependent taurine dioxygenase